jgi:hypothetical protein
MRGLLIMIIDGFNYYETIISSLASIAVLAVFLVALVIDGLKEN